MSVLEGKKIRNLKYFHLKHFRGGRLNPNDLCSKEQVHTVNKGIIGGRPLFLLCEGAASQRLWLPVWFRGG